MEVGAICRPARLDYSGRKIASKPTISCPVWCAHTVWSYRKDRRTHTRTHSRMITWSVTFRWKIGHVAGRGGGEGRGVFFTVPRFTYKFEFYLLRCCRRKRRNHKQLVAWGGTWEPIATVSPCGRENESRNRQLRFFVCRFCLLTYCFWKFQRFLILNDIYRGKIQIFNVSI